MAGAATAPSPPAPDEPSQLALFAGADRWVVRLAVASESEPGLTYTVAIDAAGDWGCSCPAWIYDPARPACKHIRAAQAARAARAEAAERRPRLSGGASA